MDSIYVSESHDYVMDKLISSYLLNEIYFIRSLRINLDVYAFYSKIQWGLFVFFKNVKFFSIVE